MQVTVKPKKLDEAVMFLVGPKIPIKGLNTLKPYRVRALQKLEPL
jgi:hypothetical protein